MSVSIARLRASPSSPLSAPKATSTWPSRREAAERPGDVGGRDEIDAPGLAALRPLPVDRLGRPVVGDRGRHQDDVRVGVRESLATKVGGGRRRHDLDALGRRHLQVRGEQRHGGAAVARRLRERDAHAAGRAVPEVPHGVERLARAARRDEHAAARRAVPLPSASPASSDSHALVRSPPARSSGPIPTRPSASSPCSGPTTTRAAVDEQAEVRPASRGAPTSPCSSPARRTSGPRWASAVSVSRSSASPCASRARVLRRERRDDEQVGVLEVRVRVGRRRLPRERPERLGRDEPLGAARHDRRHVVPRADELAHELAGLVGRDAACHPEEDPRHADSVPVDCHDRSGPTAPSVGHAER